jgi:hypothetical protein
MTAISRDRIVVPSLALAAAFGTAVVYVAHVRSEPPGKTIAATVGLAIAVPGSGARIKGFAAFANAQAKLIDVTNPLAALPAPPDNDQSEPVFDIARIERTGDAVIAGRAAPGAIVELLLNGERKDRAVANQSGHFVMVPPKLPPGDYGLMLRSRRPDGRQATSKQSVMVAVDEVESSSGAGRSRADVSPRIRSGP